MIDRPEPFEEVGDLPLVLRLEIDVRLGREGACGRPRGWRRRCLRRRWRGLGRWEARGGARAHGSARARSLGLRGPRQYHDLERLELEERGEDLLHAQVDGLGELADRGRSIDERQDEPVHGREREGSQAIRVEGAGGAGYESFGIDQARGSV